MRTATDIIYGSSPLPPTIPNPFSTPSRRRCTPSIAATNEARLQGVIPARNRAYEKRGRSAIRRRSLASSQMTMPLSKRADLMPG
jgi:hypothetical protein